MEKLFLGGAATGAQHGCRAWLRVCSKALDATTFGRACTVVRNWSDVLNGANFQAGGLQRTNRGFTTGAWSFDEDVNFTHPVFLGALGSMLGRSLSSKRGRFTGTFETHLSGRCPRDNGTGGVGDRNDGVVEG